MKRRAEILADIFAYLLRYFSLFDKNLTNSIKLVQEPNTYFKNLLHLLVRKLFCI